MENLSERQAQMMKYIKAFKDKSGLAPTYREIAAYMGIKSNNGVKRHIEALERKGYIQIMRYRRRGIKIMEEER